VAVSESLAGVIASIKANSTNEYWEQANPAIQAVFQNLLADTESEVRMATAQQTAAVASVLGATFANEFFPELANHVLDEGTVLRNELAGTLMEMAEPLGAQSTYNLFFEHQFKLEGDEASMPLLERLLQPSQNTNLRLVVMTKLLGLLHVMGKTESETTSPLLDMIGGLLQDTNWRVRWAAMLLLPRFAKELGTEAFEKRFVPHFKLLSKDNCALVRTDWVTVTRDIAMELGKACNGDDKAFLKRTIIPQLLENFTEKDYQTRSVLVNFASNLGDLLIGTGELEKLVPKIVQAAEDKVPNLRLQAAKSMASLISGKWIDPSLIVGSLTPALQKMANEQDLDVKAEASLGLEMV